MVRIYGIPNCDTVKKARTWLELHNVAYEFVDFKKTPPREAELERWKGAFGGWPVNRQGQTFRKHKAEFEALEESEVVNFLSAHASMIKRPVVEHDGKVVAFGFDEAGLGRLRGA